MNSDNFFIFKIKNDIAQTVFIILHHSLIKSIVIKSWEKLKLFENNIKIIMQSTNNLKFNRKQIRMFKKSRLNQISNNNESEDAFLTSKSNAFKTFLINYFIWFSNKFYHVVIDENHVVRHSNSDISQAVKLLKSLFLWIIIAT